MSRTWNCWMLNWRYMKWAQDLESLTKLAWNEKDKMSLTWWGLLLTFGNCDKLSGTKWRSLIFFVERKGLDVTVVCTHIGLERVIGYVVLSELEQKHKLNLLVRSVYELAEQIRHWKIAFVSWVFENSSDYKLTGFTWRDYRTDEDILSKLKIIHF